MFGGPRACSTPCPSGRWRQRALVAAVRAVPRDDRPRRSGLGLGRRRRRRVRERAAPACFQEYADSLPLHRRARLAGNRGHPGGCLLYGLAIVLVVMFEPEGLAGLARKVRKRFATVPRDPTPPRVSRSTHNPKRSPPMKTKHPRSSSTRRDRPGLFGAGCGTKGSGGEGSSSGGSRPTGASRARRSRSVPSPTSPASSPHSARTSPTPRRCTGSSRTPGTRCAGSTTSSSR